MGTVYSGDTVSFEGKLVIPCHVKFFDLLWLIQDTNNINAGLGVKLNKSDSLYHCIRSFINLRQRENDPNDTFKLSFDNIYKTMDMVGG